MDALGRLEGAGKVVVDLQAGRATLYPAPGAKFRRGDIETSLSGAGVKVGDVRIEATGDAAEEGGVWIFRLPADDARYAAAARGPAIGSVRVTLVVRKDGTTVVEESTPR